MGQVNNLGGTSREMATGDTCGADQLVLDADLGPRLPIGACACSLCLGTLAWIQQARSEPREKVGGWGMGANVTADFKLGGRAGLSREQLNQICQILGIPDPPKGRLPTGRGVKYILVLEAKAKVPKTPKKK